MRKWLVLAAVFVILLFSLYTPNTIYVEQAGGQFGFMSSIGSAISSAASSVGNAISSAAKAVSSAISAVVSTVTKAVSSVISSIASAFSGGTGSSSSGSGSGSGSGGSSGGSSSGSSGGTSGGGSGGSSGLQQCPYECCLSTQSTYAVKGCQSGKSCVNNVCVSGGGGGGGGGDGSGSSGGIVGWFKNLLVPQKPATAALGAKTEADFSGAAPFDGNTGARAASNPLAAATTGLLALTGVGTAVAAYNFYKSPAAANIAKGWQYAAEGLWNGACNLVGSAGNALAAGGKALYGAIDYASKNPIDTLKAVGTAALGAAVYVGSGKMSMDIGKFAINGAIAYGNALKTDPWGTLAKTAIVVGGIVAAIPSGGTSLLVAGAAIGAVGAGTLIIKDSYDFSQAKNDAELKQLGNEKSGDIIWVGGAALTGVQALKIAGVTKATVVAKTKAEMEEMTMSVWGEARSPPALASGNPMVTGDATRKTINIVQNTNSKIFIAHEKAVMAHETFGETAYLKGVIKMPQWVNANPLFHDVAVDGVVSNFVGKETLEAAGHNWWTNPEAWGLSTEQVSNIQKATQVPSWYKGSVGPYVSGGLTAGSAVNVNTTNMTVQ